MLSQKLQEELNYEKETGGASNEVPQFVSDFQKQGIWTVSSSLFEHSSLSHLYCSPTSASSQAMHIRVAFLFLFLRPAPQHLRIATMLLTLCSPPPRSKMFQGMMKSHSRGSSAMKSACLLSSIPLPSARVLGLSDLVVIPSPLPSFRDGSLSASLFLSLTVLLVLF